jgi:GDP-4-dehydro-6-deoxy-D-mannose reductase
MPRALVFAGASFVGQHLCRLLREKGVQVVPTARQPADDQTIVCDLTHAENVCAVIEQTRPDWIIQCGAATASSAPADHYAVHVTGALNVLEAAQQFVPRASLVLFGSAAEYGPVQAAGLPVAETCPCHPTSFFGASKLAQTQLAHAAAATNDQRIAVVRPFNIIGPGLPDHYFATALARRLIRQTADLEAGITTDRTFEVHNPHATRDFIDVRDVAAAVWLLLEESPLTCGSAGVFNVATGRETSILDVACVLGELSGSLQPTHGGEMDSRGGITRSAGDAGLLRQLGWDVTTNLRDSLTDQWNSFSMSAIDRNTG